MGNGSILIRDQIRKYRLGVTHMYGKVYKAGILILDISLSKGPKKTYRNDML
jgi:hypothetical protein